MLSEGLNKEKKTECKVIFLPAFNSFRALLDANRIINSRINFFFEIKKLKITKIHILNIIKVLEFDYFEMLQKKTP